MVVLASTIGCRIDAPSASYESWDGKTSFDGVSVTRIDTTRGAVWSEPAELVEELAIGVAAGAEPYMLGSVPDVAFHDQRIHVIDASIPVLRVFAASGAHLFDIGRDGEGPGEFKAPKNIGVANDGRIFVRDDRLSRINVYATDGDFLTSYPINAGLMGWLPMVVTPEGIPYVLRDVDYDRTTEMVPHGETGPVDGTVHRPDLGFEPWVLTSTSPPCLESPVPYAPAYHWALASDGRVVAGTSDAYEFRVVHPDGQTLIIQRRVDPTPFLSDEREYRRRYHEIRRRRGCGPDWSWNGPDMPAHKPAYFDLLPVRDGGVWVLRHGPSERIPTWACEPDPGLDTHRLGPSCWQDTKIVDAFDQEGRYLGEVMLPAELEYEIHRLQYSAEIRHDSVVTPESDRDGTIRIKWYRLHTTRGGPQR